MSHVMVWALPTSPN